MEKCKFGLVIRCYLGIIDNFVDGSVIVDNKILF